jgi:hypothetical protein
MSVLIHCPTLQRTASIDRVIGQYGSGDGPVVVVIAGVHGNEPAGVYAILDLLDSLNETSPDFCGKVIGLAGNLAALKNNVRYIDRDLNRMWIRENVEAAYDPALLNESQPRCAELDEVRALYDVIKGIMANETGPFHFVDLHTTSSVSPPFIPFDDTLSNRNFVEHFPVPGILGIEEFLPGTLLSYMTRYNVVAIGYEAGQHREPSSIGFHHAMLALCLEKAGCVARENFPVLAEHEETLRKRAEGLQGFYEVRYRYAIEEGEGFRMLPGFTSFQPVSRMQPLAENNQGSIKAQENGRIFMPLYQAQGNDGYFLIRPIARFWLKLSKVLRRWRAERVLTWLPGVRRLQDEQNTVTVNTRIAKFKVREFLHLLGYRLQGVEGNTMRFSRREP